MVTRWWLRLLFRLTMLAAYLAPRAVSAQPADTEMPAIEEAAQICASCHGEKGVPIDKTIPVIWGQREGYLYIQLRDYKRGARRNEQMAAIVEGLDRAKMLALAAYFAAKPWPDLQQARAPGDVAHHAETVAASAQCTQCHLSGFLGDSVNPRLAGQNLAYLQKTMMDFRSGARANNDWMTALLKTYPDSDIDALAHYLAGL